MPAGPQLLTWTPSELVEAAVTPWVIAAFEEGREVSPAHEDAIRAVLEAVGMAVHSRSPTSVLGQRASPTRLAIERRGH